MALGACAKRIITDDKHLRHDFFAKMVLMFDSALPTTKKHSFRLSVSHESIRPIHILLQAQPLY